MEEEGVEISDVDEPMLALPLPRPTTRGRRRPLSAPSSARVTFHSPMKSTSADSALHLDPPPARALIVSDHQ